MTANAQTAGLIPFLIEWGDTPHPAATAPQGLVLLALHLEHPEPDSLKGPLAALGSDVEVRQSPVPGIVALIDGPCGVQELR